MTHYDMEKYIRIENPSKETLQWAHNKVNHAIYSLEEEIKVKQLQLAKVKGYKQEILDKL